MKKMSLNREDLKDIWLSSLTKDSKLVLVNVIYLITNLINSIKKAFTLAEIMIALSIIGIITAVI